MKLTIDLSEKESKLISQIKDLQGEIGGTILFPRHSQKTELRSCRNL